MSKAVIYTINEKEYNEAMRILHKLGYKWYDGDPCNEGWKPSDGVNRLIYLTLDSKSKLISFDTEEPERYRYDDDIMPLEKFKMQHPTPFTKVDLEDGMIVRTRSGNYYMYFKKFNKFIHRAVCLHMDQFNDDLTNTGDSMRDILAVYVPSNLNSFDFATQVDPSDIIWKRPEKVYMTISEIEKKLGIQNLEIVEE